MRRLSTFHNGGLQNRLKQPRKNTVVVNPTVNNEDSDSNDDIAYGPDAMFGKKKSDHMSSEQLSDSDTSVVRIEGDGSLGGDLGSRRGS